ncbi:MAG: NAD-dependent epimerase/dehydratase family protein [Thermodesulfobacteriota bacterium]|nr:NAD-dependent epimerase/dehydratase family protein [Thermodesulfobacteriota bacterium]
MSFLFGILNYLEAARHCNVKRFVFASSGVPAGEVEPPIHEELPPHPVSPYGASKLAGEGYCSAYFRTFGVETVCLRFGNVYGPLSGKKDSVVAKFIKRAAEGLDLEIYGDGRQTRDFIYIDDLVSAVRLAATVEKAAGETFQIATNHETTVYEMVRLLVPALEDHGISNIKMKYGEKRQGDVMRNFSDTTKAQDVLGWECREKLKTGLEKTVKWFLKDSG